MTVYDDSTFLLTVIGMVGAGALVFLKFMLKSRCEQITCCCINCKRQVLNPDDFAHANNV